MQGHHDSRKTDQEGTMSSSSIRVEKETLAKLRVLSRDEKRPIGQIVTDLVKRYERDKFFAEMKEGFERLRADPVAWKEYQDETRLWDSASGDGLENEEPYYTPEEEEEINAEYARTYGR
jgi:hypothetical protein